jgi:hypothetical protein
MFLVWVKLPSLAPIFGLQLAEHHPGLLVVESWVVKLVEQRC